MRLGGANKSSAPLAAFRTSKRLLLGLLLCRAHWWRINIKVCRVPTSDKEVHELRQRNCNLVLMVPGARQTREELLKGNSLEDELDTPEPSRAEAFVSQKAA
jgi:hypothetical protein